MPSADKPFKVGDRVILMPGKGISLRHATESRVSKVRKDGKFYIGELDEDFLFSRTGHDTRFHEGMKEQFAHVEHWTQERAAEVSRVKLADRVAVKLRNLSQLDPLSTEQLCRIEALLDKITEERAKEQADG